jgi:ATP adenylyltransferase
MDRLWAPWRIRYILSDKQSDCFLCRKPGQDNDEKNLILIRDRTCFVCLNAYPYNPGHLLVAPYKHAPDLDQLAEPELAELMSLTRRAKQVLATAIRPDGFNIGINLGRVAGAGVADHLHVHIVPRWNGDTNYLPVLADTRVIPQALEELYATLRTAL